MLERLVQPANISSTSPNTKPSSKVTLIKSGILAKVDSVALVVSKVHPLPIVNEVIPLVFSNACLQILAFGIVKLTSFNDVKPLKFAKIFFVHSENSMFTTLASKKSFMSSSLT